MLLRRILKPLAVAGLLAIAPNALGQQPPVDVFVALSKTSYLLDDTAGTDPIDVTIGLENISDEDLIAAGGLEQRQYDKDLLFIAPDGRQIRANSLKDTQVTQSTGGEPADAPPPRVCRVGEDLVQCDLVEVLKGQLDPFPFILEFPNEDLGELLDARDDFSFDQTGYWKVKAIVPIRLYNSVLVVNRNGVPFARVGDGFAVSGNSNTEVFALTGDADGDGFSWSPENPVDCDDTDQAINPGAAEVLGNGIDDDCDAATLDELVVTPGPDGAIKVRTQKVIKTVGFPHRNPHRHPRVTKVPIVDMQVRLFDRTSPCLLTFAPYRRNFESIWLSCVTPFIGHTGDDGRLAIDVPPGRYLVIGEVPGEDELYIGSKTRRVKPERTTRTRLSFTVKKEESWKKVAGKWHNFINSLTIGSDDVWWKSDSEPRPLIYRSEEDDWTMNSSIELLEKRKKKALNRKLTMKELKDTIRKAIKARKSSKYRPWEG